MKKTLMKEKVMKTQMLKVAVVCWLVLSAGIVVAQEDAQVITLPLSSPDKPVSLEIGILSAHIEVIGEDRKDAEFTVTTYGGNRKIITPSGPKSIAGVSFQVEVEENSNRIEVKSNTMQNRVNIVARIPRQADLDLSTTNNGDIVVSNITGKLELKNVNGPISATAISGTVIAETVNGEVSIGFKEISSDGATLLSTFNGDLELFLPSKAGAELHIDSFRGEITSDFEVELTPTKPAVTRDKHNNGYSVQVENSIVATINGGGPVVRLKSFNGDIQISKRDSK